MMKSFFCLLISAALLTSIQCLGDPHSSDKFNNWKTECVGRYQLSMPGEVEMAVNKPASYKGSTNQASFVDGQKAPFSQLDYFGDLYIISPASEADFIKYKKNVVSSLIDLKREWLSSGTEKVKKSAPAMKSMTYDTPTLFGWDAEDYMPGLYYFLESKIFVHRFTNYELDDIEHRALNKKYFNNFLTNFHPRPLYTLLNQPGVCIPYGFIADDGTGSRDIGVTMRLIDHPEVEIFFRDTSGTLNDYEPKKEIEYFWTIMYQQFTKLTEADFWGYRSIKMGGQKGKGMLATIHRHDGSIDYGYIAVVSDNANLPSQMLYVIRTAARAKGKPVGIDDIKNIAEKIMASVKPHAVQ